MSAAIVRPRGLLARGEDFPPFGAGFVPTSELFSMPMPELFFMPTSELFFVPMPELFLCPCRIMFVVPMSRPKGVAYVQEYIFLQTNPVSTLLMNRRPKEYAARL